MQIVQPAVTPGGPVDSAREIIGLIAWDSTAVRHIYDAEDGPLCVRACGFLV